MNKQLLQIKEIIDESNRIVIIQADNPDADSLGSALALESILTEMGKHIHMYCGVDMPTYLRYLPGWDRVEREIPNQFDASIVVDASTMTLLERLGSSGYDRLIAARPSIVLDHHETVENVVPFATVILNEHTRSSTGELIHYIAHELSWTLPKDANEAIMTAILGDTQGLTNQLASVDTYKVMTSLVEAGVDRPELEERRREYSKMPPEIYKYKAALISRTEFVLQGALAIVVIPQQEINSFSPLYNPAPLIQGDMLQTTGVKLAIVFKEYADGKVTGAIRCNPGYGIGANLAQKLGGGGHAFASGFKDVSGKSFASIKNDCVRTASELLSKLEEGEPDAPVQYAYQTD